VKASDAEAGKREQMQSADAAETRDGHALLAQGMLFVA
jgi:hypothetical protein